MSDFFITEYSIGFICPAFFSMLISGVLFLRQVRSGRLRPAEMSLVLYFLGASIYNTLNFSGYSIYSENAQIIWYLQSFVIFAVIFLIRFSYFYPFEWRRRERKAVLAACTFLSAGVTAEYWISCLNSPVILYGHTYGSENISAAIPLLITLFYIWAAVVFLRKTVEHEKKTDPGRTILQILVKPATAPGRTARNFGALIFLDVLHSFVVYSVMNLTTVSAFVISLSTALLVLVICSLYVSVYLNSAYDSVPFLFKLTGIPLIIFMFIVTVSGYMMMYFRSISYDEMNWALLSSERSIRNESMSPVPAVSYIAAAENDGWRVIYDKDKILPEKIVSRLWDKTPSGVQITTGNTRPLFHQGEADKKFFLQVNNTNYLQYNIKQGSTVYGYGIPYINYLRYMHKTGSTIAAVMIFFIIPILTLLPLLYHLGIVGPLRQIIRNSAVNDNTPVNTGNEIAHIGRILKKNSELRKAKPLPEKPDEISAPLRKKLDTISSYIEKNFLEDLSREGLASMVDLDPGYMSRLFKTYTGMKIGDYINKLRIEESCRLLATTDHSIIDISIIAGFENLRTFNRAFSRITGETPSEFRNKNQKPAGQKV